MKIKSIILLSLMLLFGSINCVYAQELVGTWRTSTTLPDGTDLQVTAIVQPNGAYYKATLYSNFENNPSITVDGITFDGLNVAYTNSDGSCSFNGTMYNDNIAGTFVWGTYTITLTFYKSVPNMLSQELPISS